MNMVARERRIRDRLARAEREFRAQGYRFIVFPEKEDLPTGLGDFRPDFIAIKGDEVVVGEVKSRESAASQPGLKELAERTAGNHNWRAEILWLGEEPDEISNSLYVEELAGRVGSVAEVDLAAAFLLAVAALEAAVNIFVVRRGIRSPKPALGARLAEIYSLGHITEAQYGILRTGWSVRNRLVHGYRAENDVDHELMQSVIDFALYLSRDDYCSVDEMVEWFLENYEDPANGVPYESAEGGYIYILGGPYHADDVLSEKFPHADYGSIREATSILESTTPEWVKKGEY